MRRKSVLLALAACAVALVIAGCGDDDDDGGGGDVGEVSIEATGGEGSLAYEATGEADAGANEISFTNSSELEELDAQLVYTAEEHTDQEVTAELRKAIEGQPVADWFQGGGGVGSTPRGESDTVTQELQEGTYYVVGGEDVPKPPLAKVEVAGDGGADLPDADATVSAVEYSFSGEGLKAGEQSLLLENTGAQWHHFIGFPLKEDATIEEVRRFFETEEGPPPFEGDESAGVESTVLEGGTSQLVDVDLQPGRYAFVCFITDKQGGPPHVAKGMVSEVTVEE